MTMFITAANVSMDGVWCGMTGALGLSGSVGGSTLMDVWADTVDIPDDEESMFGSNQ